MEDDPIITRLIQWGAAQPLVRAMILTSTRAVPGTSSDCFSDYDVILALSDVRPFFEGRTWLEAFGHVLVMYQDPLEKEGDFLHSGNVVQFEGGLKIDFSLWQAEMMHRFTASPPPVEAQYFASTETQFIVSQRAEFEAGYRILLDKDGLADGLKPPTYQAFISKPPTETEFRESIEVGLLDATYVAKYLRREDLMAARIILETFLKDEHLRPMLEWHYEIEHGWSVKAGLHGRRMKKYLRPDLWADLEKTYTGLDLEENWDALFRTLALLRKAGLEVADRLGFPYPHEMERRALAYLQSIKVSMFNEK